MTIFRVGISSKPEGKGFGEIDRKYPTTLTWSKRVEGVYAGR